MILFPAIDIRGGRCVRLIEGDFDRETVFGDDPAAMAAQWESQGASWIHIVDLDGARDGMPRNAGAVREIRDRVGVSIQVGGGIRSESDVQRYLEAGVDRVVLGTIAIYDPDLIERIAGQWGDRIAVGLDARNGKLAGSGWIDQTESSALNTALDLRARGVETFIYTDITRDGTLIGPNLAEITHMVQALHRGVIASGGVSQQSDLVGIRETGAEGVIVGRALYDGRVTMAEALEAAKREKAV
ncbi:MAG: 1-(5-phosphoribosyl)-5-[(5-phosphoribosylamino)methylideneamino]imidazole-4-carboxamide isomerase [Thermomicrobiales bacterium]|nr:1-(5-phosphoribosyl)-5-[(5-phosphoribosylamino)methylideneamino]imidazole-4-carboxamide isomerase [Thermomicrobiales bacterium]